MKKEILVSFLGGNTFRKPIQYQLIFSKFDIRNMILFQIKAFSRIIKETTLVRYFIKVTVRLRFTLLLHHQANKQSQLNIKLENILQKFSCISFLYKPLRFHQGCQRAQLDVAQFFFLQFFERQVRWSVTPIDFMSN